MSRRMCIYRIRFNAASLLHRAPCFWKVHFLGFFLNTTSLFCSKVHFLRSNLNWTSPKNPEWKKEPWGCIQADTVLKSKALKWPLSVQILLNFLKWILSITYLKNTNLSSKYLFLLGISVRSSCGLQVINPELIFCQSRVIS